MTAAPAVSVILPTYNRAASLCRAVRSVLAQTMRDLELIVVDDRSTDDTAQLIAGIADPRLRYLKLDRQHGASGARNAGARLARGAWLAFQDSDDEWTPGKLAAQLQAAAAAPANSGLICSWYLILPKNGQGRAQLLGKRAWPRGPWPAREGYRFPFITPTWLISRARFAQLGGFDETLGNLEDWEMAFRLLRDGDGVQVIEAPLVVKHVVDGSLYLDVGSRLPALQAILVKHQDWWATDPQVAATLLCEIGCLQCRSGNAAAGRSTLARSLRARPTAKAFGHWALACGGESTYRTGRALAAVLRNGRVRSAG